MIAIDFSISGGTKLCGYCHCYETNKFHWSVTQSNGEYNNHNKTNSLKYNHYVFFFLKEKYNHCVIYIIFQYI